MSNRWIAEDAYEIVLNEITSVLDVEDQKEIVTYVINDLIHRFDLWEKHIYHLVVKLNRKDNVTKIENLFWTLTNKELLRLIDLLEKYDFSNKYVVRNFNELISINKLN